ncbi:MAG: peptidoglycan-binding protein LysM, partial [Glaciimonas sp.]|nr:peptidoglycan-binding protein LysM [Glaciimonas sp.]
MGLLSFVADAGKKLLGIKDAQAAATSAAPAPNLGELEQKAADAIKADIAANGLTADGLD